MSVESGAGRTALLLGATGATGRYVLSELLSRPGWSRVVAVGRRPADAGENPGAAKLENVVVEDLASPGVELDAAKLGKIDVFFNCIGTTRANAGGADSFYAVEVTTSEKVAKAAKQAGAKQALVVSAMGAAPNRSVAPKWFHPLFYGKCMGLKEHALLSQSFEQVSIFRPGMLHRGMNDRPVEKYLFFLPSIKVQDLATAMVNVAENPANEPVTIIEGNGKIRTHL